MRPKTPTRVRERDREAAPGPSPAGDARPAAAAVTYAEREGWEFVHFLGAHLASLETRAAILIPAQVAALIALWSQFFTFEEALPHTLAWVAWGFLALALFGAGWLVTPERLRPGALVGYGLTGGHSDEREAILAEVCELVQRRVRLLHTGLRASVSLTLIAFAIVVLAYGIDKAFLAP